MAKIIELVEDTEFDSDDVIIKDGANGTKIMSASDFAIELAGLISPENHRNVYRGKNLGTSLTQDQIAAIQNGTFDDLFIGDYWTINGVRYDIADMDYWYQIGDTAFTRHHLVMISHNTMGNAKMNNTNITTGGYIGSAMRAGYTETDPDTQEVITHDPYIKVFADRISAAFGDNLLTHRSYFSNAVSSGAASAGAWVDSTVDLMSEKMVYGTRIRGNERTVATSDKAQLAIFDLKPSEVNRPRTAQWLRDVYSATLFAGVPGNGNANPSGASISYGVRPAFAVG